MIKKSKDVLKAKKNVNGLNNGLVNGLVNGLTIADVAKEAGCSVATASRILSGS